MSKIRYITQYNLCRWSMNGRGWDGTDGPYQFAIIDTVGNRNHPTKKNIKLADAESWVKGDHNTGMILEFIYE